MDVRKITKKDRYGNQMTYEFEVPKPLDETAITKHMMDKAMDTPMMHTDGMDMEMSMGIPEMHPGGPKGSDTVPAWLTPGEFVVNKEATDMYGPIIEQMNNHGRQMQQGGDVQYHQQGGFSLAPSYDITQFPGYEDNTSESIGLFDKDWQANVESVIPDEVKKAAAVLHAYDQGFGGNIGDSNWSYNINPKEESASLNWGLKFNEGGSVELPKSYAQTLLESREGYRDDVYLDSLGKPTVGHGHLLPEEYKEKVGSKPFSKKQLDDFFKMDIDTATEAARKNIKNFDKLNKQQQGALISMAFQLGPTGQSKFENMIDAIENERWDEVGAHAKDSLWAQQTPVRANDIVQAFMEGGHVPPVYLNQGDELDEDIWATDPRAAIREELNIPEVSPGYYNEGINDFSPDGPAAWFPGQGESPQGSSGTEVPYVEGLDVDPTLGPALNSNVITPEEDAVNLSPGEEPSTTGPVTSFINDYILGENAQLGDETLQNIANLGLGEAYQYDTKKRKIKDTYTTPTLAFEEELDETTNAVEEAASDEALKMAEEIKVNNPEVKAIDDSAKGTDPQAQNDATQSVINNMSEDEKNDILEQGKKFFEDFNFLGFDGQDLGRFLLYTAGGLATGGSLQGSLQWAGAQALQENSARRAAAAKAKAESKIGQKTGTNKKFKIEGGQLNDQEITFYEKYTENGKELVANVDGKDFTHEQLTSYLADKGSRLTAPDASGAKAKNWSSVGKDWASTFNKQIDQEYPQEAQKANQYNFKLTGEEAATQTRQYFKSKGYDVTNPEVLAEMETISQRAIRSMASYARNNKKQQFTDVTPFLNAEILRASTGATDAVWVTNPDEENFSKKKFVAIDKVQSLSDDIERIVRAEGAESDYDVNIRRNQWFQTLANAYASMDDAERAKFGSPSKDENGFYLFVKKVVEDGKILADEL